MKRTAITRAEDAEIERGLAVEPVRNAEITNEKDADKIVGKLRLNRIHVSARLAQQSGDTACDSSP